MNVHNTIEDEVLIRVDNMYEQAEEQKLPWLTCSCEQCKSDVMCYVLNRIQPKYIVSGRGAAYASANFTKQQGADIDIVVLDGMKKIAGTQRPFHNKEKKENYVKNNPTFNFPQIIGLVFSGTTFEPLTHGKVSLYLNGELVEMVDTSWENPHEFSANVKGVYTFLPAPIMTTKSNEDRTFIFEIKVEVEGYPNNTTIIAIPLNSDNDTNTLLNSVKTFKVNDIFLLKDE